MPRQPKPVRTIEVRRIRSHQKACPDQWVVMIPLVFCTKEEARHYAVQMTTAGNRLNPKVRTRWRLIEGPPPKTTR